MKKKPGCQQRKLTNSIVVQAIFATRIRSASFSAPLLSLKKEVEIKTSIQQNRINGLSRYVATSYW